MRIFALATDYDGTIAHNGIVYKATIEALEKLKNSGRKLILVTGRELPELKEVFPEINIFDFVVAENGAMLYNPATLKEKVLYESPSEEFVNELTRRGVERISVGNCIVATWKPFEIIALEVIRDMGLDLQIIFNKDAVMILPSGLNKAFGLKAALSELYLSEHNVAAVGDAENDLPFFQLCEFSAAVNNSISSLKELSDINLKKEHGEGVAELIDMIKKDDLKSVDKKLNKHKITIGTLRSEEEIFIHHYYSSVLVAGSSGNGKSTFALSFMERLIEKKYQFCIIDPEGDYNELHNAAIMGANKQVPEADEVMRLLKNPKENCIVNLSDIPLDQRPDFFIKLYTDIVELRTKYGRPHWLILDEVHHLLPAERYFFRNMTGNLNGIFSITVDPKDVSTGFVKEANKFIVIGDEPEKSFESFCKIRGCKMPLLPADKLEIGEILLWDLDNNSGPALIKTIPPKTEIIRHFPEIY